MPNIGTPVPDLDQLSGITSDDIFLVFNKEGGVYKSYKFQVADLIAGVSGASEADVAALSAFVGTSHSAGAVIFADSDGSFTSSVSGISFDQNTGTFTLTSGSSINAFNTDVTLASNLDSVVPTQRAVKTYVDTLVALSVTDFTSLSAYNGITSQSLGQISGTMIWTDTIDDTEINGYDANDTQILTNISGDIEWVDTIEKNEVPGYASNVTQVFTNTSGNIEWKNSDYYATSSQFTTLNNDITLNDADINYLSGQIIELSGQSLDLTAISGYNASTSQALTQVLGVNLWEDVVDADVIYATIADVVSNDADISYISGVVDTNTTDISSNNADIAYISGQTLILSDVSGYNLTERQALIQVSGVNLWQTTLNADSVYVTLEQYAQVSGSSVLTAYGPVASAQVISLSGSGAYEYVLSGDTSFTTIGAEAGTVKFATALLSATTSLSATFDSNWYWVGTRPTNDQILIPSGLVELVVRSSGTKIIAAYESIV